MAVDMFLKIDGVQGESQDKDHKGEIDIMSYSFGASQVGNRGFGGGGGGGRVSFQDLHFSTPVNLSSPVLLKACASGQHFAKATLTCRKAGEKPVDFLKVVLTDVLVSSYSNGSKQLDSGYSSLAEDNSDVPTDQITLNFRQVQLLYTAQSATGAAGDTTGLADSTALSASTDR